MEIKKIIFIFLLLSVTFFTQNNIDKFPKDKSDLKTQFDQAVLLYNKNEFMEHSRQSPLVSETSSRDEVYGQTMTESATAKRKDVLTTFENIVFSNEYNLYTNPSIIFISKILIKQKKFNEAEKILIDFINEQKESDYIYEAKIELSNIYFFQKNYSLAVENLISVIENSSNEKNRIYAEQFCENILLNYFSYDKINELIQKNDSKEIKSFLLLVLGKSQFKNGLYDDAINTFKKLSNDYNNTKYYKEALKFQKLINEKEVINEIKNIILILLPLSDKSGNTSQTAVDVLEGIKYAVNSYNESLSNSKNADDKIALLIKNTNRDKEQIQKIYNRVKDIRNIKLIIGPLFSDETEYVCDIFDNLNIPIISPTATADDLTSKYENFYQANPSYRIRGKLMAQYVYYVENKSQMAVLYSTEGYSSVLAKSFEYEFQKLGGKIIVSQSYSLKGNTIKREILNVKNNINKIEGIYLPISDNQYSNMILSTLILNRMSINLYGNQDWLSSSDIEKYPELSSKLIFTSDYYLDYSNNNLLSFSNDIKNKTNSEINRNFMYGYDITNFIVNLIDKNNNSKELLAKLIQNKEFKNGFHNYIYFGEDRINQYLNIIRFKDGKYELVDRFKYNN